MIKKIYQYMEKKYLFIPQGITVGDVNVLINGTRYHKRISNNILIFLHLITTKMIYSGEDNRECYVQISKEDIRSLLGNDYVKWRDRLIKEGWLEVKQIEILDEKTGELKVVDAFKKGDTCKQYRIKNFTAYYRMDITNDETVKEKLKELRGYRINEKAIYQVHAKNVDNLILLDTEEARKELDFYFQSIGRNFDAEHFIDLFNGSVFELSIDDFGNRFNAKQTRFKKDFRKYLRFKGYENEVLYNVDICNSQPLLFAELSSHLIKNLAPECSEAIAVYEHYQNNKDVQRFRRLCRNKEIYEYLQEQFEKHFKIIINRDEAKKVYYYSNFAAYPDDTMDLELQVKNVLSKSGGIWDKDGEIIKKRMRPLSLYLFKILFPSLYTINEEIKYFDWKHLVKNQEEYKQHSSTCLLMQRIESSLLIVRTSEILIKNGVENFVTIHDSFLVRKKDTGKVKKAIREAFYRVGLPCPKTTSKVC
jgi:hypothetical protein